MEEKQSGANRGKEKGGRKRGESGELGELWQRSKKEGGREVEEGECSQLRQEGERWEEERGRREEWRKRERSRVGEFVAEESKSREGRMWKRKSLQPSQEGRREELTKGGEEEKMWGN